MGGSDGECWRLFERFEKGLKLAWVYFLGRESGFRGVMAVLEMRNAGRHDLDFELIAQQRNQGLLGMYLTSLRAMGLVDKGRLTPTTAGRTLVDGTQFSWDGEAGGTLKWLYPFKNLGFSSLQRRRLGMRLFGAPEMISVARAVRKYGPDPAWRKASATFAGEAREVARNAESFSLVASRATAAFHDLLRNPAQESRLGWIRLFPAGWVSVVFREGLSSLATPFSGFLKTAHKQGAGALVQLHQDVWKHRGHSAPWIRSHPDGHYSVRRDAHSKTSSLGEGMDHRWSVCHQLIQETRWGR